MKRLELDIKTCLDCPYNHPLDYDSECRAGARADHFLLFYNQDGFTDNSVHENCPLPEKDPCATEHHNGFEFHPDGRVEPL